MVRLVMIYSTSSFVGSSITFGDALVARFYLGRSGLIEVN